MIAAYLVVVLLGALVFVGVPWLIVRRFGRRARAVYVILWGLLAAVFSLDHMLYTVPDDLETFLSMALPLGLPEWVAFVMALGFYLVDSGPRGTGGEGEAEGQ